ncbi:fungal-specific transcription factor domain-containing protein [Aspergillus unguis]
METPEIGSLTAHSPQESQFVGSSSGVFFVNTVRRAFGSSREFPQPEDTLVGSEDTHADHHEETPVSQWEYDPSIACVLGQAPPQHIARDLMMVYFKVWHPLFPFIHGPTFLHAMESLYSTDPQNKSRSPQESSTRPSLRSKNKHNTSWTAIFQCVFHLAALITDDKDLQLPPECKIQTPVSASIHALLSPLTARHDLLSLQALLVSQLYLVATMSLRTASTVGGCMLRSMLHAGLHRCPFRYRELSTSSAHRHLRKRIFWSAYALDRYLSQALGLPLGVQDSDIDVCPPGCVEMHKPLQHLPVSRSGIGTPVSADPNLSPAQAEAEVERSRKEGPFASYVQAGKLTGEALELFHKSIYVRSISQISVLVLTTSVHKWWNSLDLPPPPAESSSVSSKDETPFNYTPFFTILYQHLILLLHRPSLSLPNNTPEFASALQSCISAARHILTALNTQRDSGQALFWPGFLSAAWMSGLVLAFACQLGQYVLSRAVVEINSCLDILRAMARQWEPAKHCHRALMVLLRAVSRDDTTVAETGTSAVTSTYTNSKPQASTVGREDSSSHSPISTRKKRKLDASATTNRDSQTIAGASTSLDYDAESIPQPQPATGSWDNSLSFNSDAEFGLDMNMVDLLQEGNFDSLMDLFGQQYPTF